MDSCTNLVTRHFCYDATESPYHLQNAAVSPSSLRIVNVMIIENSPALLRAGCILLPQQFDGLDGPVCICAPWCWGKIPALKIAQALKDTFPIS